MNGRWLFDANHRLIRVIISAYITVVCVCAVTADFAEPTVTADAVCRPVSTVCQTTRMRKSCYRAIGCLNRARVQRQWRSAAHTGGTTSFSELALWSTRTPPWWMHSSTVTRPIHVARPHLVQHRRCRKVRHSHPCRQRRLWTRTRTRARMISETKRLEQ